MKILLISPFTSQSGSAIRFWNIALQFKERGCDVVYVDRGSRSGRHLYRADGITYRPGRIIGPLFIDIPLSTIYNLFILLRHLDCTLFYALKPAPNNCIPALVARLFGKKTILDIDDLDYEYLAPGMKRYLSRVFFHLFPRLFPLVTCHTQSLLAFCKNDLCIPQSRLYFLAQGVSSEFLCMATGKKQPLSKSIIYVATLGITSDFDDCIPLLDRLCARHVDATVTIVGDGPRRASFEATIRNRGLSRAVTFVGQVDHDKLPLIMAAHAIGINYMRPSRVNDCRAILKIREYLACGLQVVCNNTGDAAEFRGVAFVEQDLDAMERRLLDLLGRPHEVNYVGVAFVERHYSWNAIVDQLFRTLHEKNLLPKKAG